ncbi:FlgD immunoglobulin-like domain containing protein [Fulvivirgaceae bacterium BMA10]|uniref:FlgD immunoglobulin-like domain containing protein n=1 Tax=Splendidivirga corallicola TaxID=3051826 RepID=A0ABT8KNJ2_9BACT|nr:FlgD immunoglobulin-like domain containing protein [Fulvivirgaceae bacterium BMA10]
MRIKIPLSTAWSAILVCPIICISAIGFNPMMSDPSFYEELQLHKTEINALAATYAVSNPSYIETYDMLLEVLVGYSKSQMAFMDQAGIDLDEIRLTQAEMQSLGYTSTEITETLANQTLVKNHFQVHASAITEVNTLINNIKPDLSTGLEADVSTFQSYINLGVPLQYTYYEVFYDATGYLDPDEFLTTGLNSWRLANNIRGRGANESLNRIKDLLNSGQAEMTLGYHIFPNPFAKEVNIMYDLPEATNVSIKIFTTEGKLVKKVYEGPGRKGANYVSWDATDEKGKRLSNGIFITELSFNNSRQTKRLLLENK